MQRIAIAFLAVCTMFLFSCKQTTSTESETTEVSKSSVSVENSRKSSIKTSVSSDNNNIKVANKEGMRWYGMGEVEALVKENPKKILVDVYTQWCGPCKMMDKMTFTDSEVQAKINEKFYPVKFDAEGPNTIEFMGKEYGNPGHDPNRRGRNAPHQLSKFFAVRGYPTLVVLDENFNILHKIVGFKQPDQLLAAIEAI